MEILRSLSKKSRHDAKSTSDQFLHY